jgi:hypothetical protein
LKSSGTLILPFSNPSFVGVSAPIGLSRAIGLPDLRGPTAPPWA